MQIRFLFVSFVQLGTLSVGTEIVLMKPIACQFFTNKEPLKIIGKDDCGVACVVVIEKER